MTWPEPRAWSWRRATHSTRKPCRTWKIGWLPALLRSPVAPIPPFCPRRGGPATGETGYTQTVACEGMTADVVTLQPMILPTGDRATDIAAREALGYISMVETLAGQVTVTCWEDKPAVALTIYLVEAR